MIENADDEPELQIEIESDEPEGLEVEGFESRSKPAPVEKVETVEKTAEAVVPAADAAVDALKQDRDRLESRANTAERTVAQTRADAANQVARAQYEAVTNAITATAVKLTDAERALKTAWENGDYEKAAKVQTEIAELTVDRRELDRSQKAIDQQIKNPEPDFSGDPVAAVIASAARSGAPLSTKAQSWLREHPDVCSNRSLNAKISWVHTEALDKGLAVDSDDYYKFVNEQMGYTKPEAVPEKVVAEQVEAKPAIKPARKMVSAPVSRDVPASNGNMTGMPVKLTASEARSATDGTIPWNYDDPTGKNRFKKGDPIGVQEFARRKMKMTESGAYDRVNTHQ